MRTDSLKHLKLELFYVREEIKIADKLSHEEFKAYLIVKESEVLNRINTLQGRIGQ